MSFKYVGGEKQSAVGGLTLLFVLLGSMSLFAQGFDSGSDGSDGALNIAANQGTVNFNPASFDPPLDPDGDKIYHFTSITIGQNTTVRLRADILGEGRPVVWLATGAVEIAGILNLDGERGHAWNTPALPAVGGAGGFNGGPGGTVGSPAPRGGSGPGGGEAQPDRHGGGGGHVTPGGTANQTPAPGGIAYGNFFLFPLLGGSGAGGGAYDTTGDRSGSGGGGGGGAILIASSTSIEVRGQLFARGGGGGGRTVFAGGGGSGGSIRLIAPTINGNGRLDVSGGGAGFTANSGSAGRIRIETFQYSYTGAIVPFTTTTFSSPGLVFPPADTPVVRVTRVGGVDVAANPTASFVNPDVVIDTDTTVTLEIAAANIPIGTQIRLRMVPENGESIVLMSTPLAGDLAGSTATTDPVTIPHGFSRFHISATWTPPGN